MCTARRIAILSIALVAMFAAGCGEDPVVDEAIPAGNSMIGDEPGNTVDDEAPLAEGDGTNYGLLVVLALCLIVAGGLLVAVERHGRRHADGVPPVAE